MELKLIDEIKKEDTIALKPQYLIVVIPAFNEERFIGSVVLNARHHVDKVIVVDDGSSDATAEIAESAGAIVVRHEKNFGKGVALNTGFRTALELGAKVLVVMDGDYQHLPNEVHNLWTPVLRGDADIAVGSRYLTGQQSVPIHRVLGHRLINFLTNFGSGVNLTDSQNGFRAFSDKAIRLLRFQAQGFDVESEMQFLAMKHGLKVVEVPVTVLYTDKAKRSSILHGLHVLNGLIRMCSRYKPLLSLSLLGFFLLTLGLGWFTLLLGIVLRFQSLGIESTFLMTLAMLSSGLALLLGSQFLGAFRSLFSDYSGFTNHSVKQENRLDRGWRKRTLAWGRRNGWRAATAKGSQNWPDLYAVSGDLSNDLNENPVGLNLEDRQKADQKSLAA